MPEFDVKMAQEPLAEKFTNHELKNSLVNVKTFSMIDSLVQQLDMAAFGLHLTCISEVSNG